ncbi:hypothetical protein D3C73_776820 [compost metagenome]
MEPNVEYLSVSPSTFLPHASLQVTPASSRACRGRLSRTPSAVSTKEMIRVHWLRPSLYDSLRSALGSRNKWKKSVPRYRDRPVYCSQRISVPSQSGSVLAEAAVSEAGADSPLPTMNGMTPVIGCPSAETTRQLTV